MAKKRKASYGPQSNRAKTDQSRALPRKQPALTAKQAAENLKEIAEYFQARRNKLKIVKTTKTRGGQVIDWIPIESQERGGKIAKPPESAASRGESNARANRKDEQPAFELETQQAVRGPDGTVPIARVDLSKLKNAVRLQDLLSKHGRPVMRLKIDDQDELEVPADASDHEYAYSAQWVTCYGGDGRINCWDPYVQWSNEFSLGQIALARNSGDSKQTIEAGWQVYKNLYGDWDPHLFVFYTTNGYTSSGDNKGGYNQDVAGWRQYSATIFPAARISPVSTHGGAQKILRFKYQLYQGNWWLWVKDQWIGYYPASLFNSAGLRSRAEKVAFYGEIVDAHNNTGMTRTDMGSGRWPSQGWQQAAYMRTLQYQSAAGGAMTQYNPGTIWESDPDCYGIEGHFGGSGSWGSYFWWGGPGMNANCP